MLYNTKKLLTTTAIPRVVDAHSLLHLRTPKAARACDAADVVDGLAVLQNLTMRLVATAYGVSLGSVARARRLTSEQRQAVRQDERPLVLPRAAAALPVPAIVPVSALPVIADAQQRLTCLVKDVGLTAVLDLLAASEKVAA